MLWILQIGLASLPTKIGSEKGFCAGVDGGCTAQTVLRPQSVNASGMTD